MILDIVYTAIGIVLLILGFLGCILPFLPGPPIAYFALLVLQLKSNPPFSTSFLVIWAVITLVVTVLDYIIPVWGTKKFGGTRGGVWGSTIGLIVTIIFFPMLGIVLGPFGLIGFLLGPFAGALIGEYITTKDSQKSFIAALGSFIGFMTGTLMKLVIVFIMAYDFVKALIF